MPQDMEAYIGGAFMLDHSYIELLYGRVNLGMSRRDYDYFWESPWFLLKRPFHELLMAPT